MMTPVKAEIIITIEWNESGLYPIHRMMRSGTKMPPRPYTARTTNVNTESPPGMYSPAIEINVAAAAT